MAVSYYFDFIDKSVWSPANRTARVFLSCVEAFEQSEGTSAGFTRKAADWISVEPLALSAFITKLLDEYDTRNQLVRCQLDGMIRPSIVMVQRCDSLERLPQRHSRLVNEALKWSPWMAT